MKTQVILVDWENVQPELLPALNLEGTKVFDWLIERKVNRPKTLKTLTNSLKTSAFAGRLSDEEIKLLIEALTATQLISVHEQKIEYPEIANA